MLHCIQTMVTILKKIWKLHKLRVCGAPAPDHPDGT